MLLQASRLFLSGLGRERKNNNRNWQSGNLPAEVISSCYSPRSNSSSTSTGIVAAAAVGTVALVLVTTAIVGKCIHTPLPSSRALDSVVTSGDRLQHPQTTGSQPGTGTSQDVMRLLTNNKRGRKRISATQNNGYFSDIL